MSTLIAANGNFSTLVSVGNTSILNTGIVFPDATSQTTAATNFQKASTAQAQAGTDDTTVMTPAKTASAITAQTKLLQRAFAQYSTWTTISGSTAAADTIPTNTQGTQIFSQAFTPLSSTSRIRIRVSGEVFIFNGGAWAYVNLFNGATNAIAARQGPSTYGASLPYTAMLEHEYAPGSTSAITFTVRVNCSSGYVYLNGNASGRTLGGVQAWTLMIEEVL